MTTDNGGPAFPTKHFDNMLRETPVGHYGMSLRDWFASQAMIGLIARVPRDEFIPEAIANISYATADAMLAKSAD